MTARRKKVSILTVGNEILSGEILDSNFRYLALRINSIGLETSMRITAPDDINSIAKCIIELLDACDILLITGGLGPTTDDLTREAISEAFGLELIKQEELERYLVNMFRKYGRKMPGRNIKQAFIPEGARIIEPAGGTAAGIMLEHSGKLVFALPGVPVEMKTMFESKVIKVLKNTVSGDDIVRTEKLNIFGIGESDVEERLSGLMEESCLKYGFLAGGGQVTVKLTAEAGSPGDLDEILGAEKEKVYGILGRRIFSEGDVTIEEVVAGLLGDRGKTVAVAESLTAGMVCERLVNVPGSSSYFMGGVVSYSTESKISILGIPAGVLSGGAANEKVACEMADSVRRLFSSDIGISTTGVAGPGSGGENRQAGTFFVGLANGVGVQSWERRVPGGRSNVRNAASTCALNVLRLFLEEALDKDPFH